MNIEAMLRPYVIVDVLGLTLTIIGALISARGAFIEDRHARKIARTEGPHNHELEQVFKDQSRSAKCEVRSTKYEVRVSVDCGRFDAADCSDLAAGGDIALLP